VKKKWKARILEYEEEKKQEEQAAQNERNKQETLRKLKNEANKEKSAIQIQRMRRGKVGRQTFTKAKQNKQNKNELNKLGRFHNNLDKNMQNGRKRRNTNNAPSIFLQKERKLQNERSVVFRNIAMLQKKIQFAKRNGADTDNLNKQLEKNRTEKKSIYERMNEHYNLKKQHKNKGVAAQLRYAAMTKVRRRRGGGKKSKSTKRCQAISKTTKSRCRKTCKQDYCYTHYNI